MYQRGVLDPTINGGNVKRVAQCRKVPKPHSSTVGLMTISLGLKICVLIHLGQRESGNGGLGNIMNSKTVDTEMATGVAECQQVSN